MSTISVTNINTANGTTDLTVKTGNTNAGALIIPANGSPVILQGNGTVNTLSISTSGITITGNAFISSTVNATSVNASSLAVGTSFTANSTVVNATSYTVGTSFIANSTTVNAASYTIGTTFTANSTVVNAISGALSVNTTALTFSPNTLNLGTSTKAANGYTWLPNGVLMQWINALVSNTAAQTFTFPITFPSNCYSLVGQVQGGPALTPAVVGITIANGSAFTANTNSGVNKLCYFIAIGY